MKVRVNRAELSEALVFASGVTPTRTPKQILQSIKIEALADELVLSATDLDLGIRCHVRQVEVSDKGSALVAADKLSQIVKSSNDEVLDIATDDTICHLRGADSHFQIYLKELKDFPSVPAFDGDPDFSVSAKVIRKLSDWTVFAAARENTRYALNGVLWERQKQKLTLVATDGRRLAKAVGETLSGTSEGSRAIVPSKGLMLFVRSLDDGEEQVDVRITSNQIALRSSRISINMALVEGHFPDYAQVIPTDSDKTATIDTHALLSAVQRASLLTNEESKGIRMAFESGGLTLSSRAPEQGEATISLPVEYDGDAVEIGFNPLFLSDVLKVVGSDEIKFELKEATRPGVIKSGSHFLYVVMPVSLS